MQRFLYHKWIYIHCSCLFPFHADFSAKKMTSPLPKATDLYWFVLPASGQQQCALESDIMPEHQLPVASSLVYHFKDWARVGPSDTINQQ